MEQKLLSKKNNKGAIMLEALIVYTVTLFLLFFVLAIFTVLFQRWNLQTIANDAAARMAQTYRLNKADEITGEVSVEELTEVGIYRYAGNLITKKMETSIDKRVSDYASWRLQKTTFTKNVTEPVIKTIVHPDALGRRHIEVSIVGEYRVPFAEAMNFFGFGKTIKYEVKAYADCVDMIDYINLVDYVDTQTNISGKFVGFIDSILNLFDNIFDN